MALTLKYQGQDISRNKDQYSYKETLQGTEAEVDAFLENLSPIGTYFQNKGYLASWRKINATGSIFNVELEYTVSYSGFNDSSSSDYGSLKRRATLSTRTIQLPLSKLNNYRTKWDHFFFAAGTSTIPTFYNSATTTNISSAYAETYAWSESENPPAVYNISGQKWNLLAEPTKKGVNYFDYSYFVVTEVEKYGSASSAGNAVEKRINKIVSPHENFGISNGNWKVDDSQVQYNGSFWEVVTVYTHSPTGWDSDIYD